MTCLFGLQWRLKALSKLNLIILNGVVLSIIDLILLD